MFTLTPIRSIAAASVVILMLCVAHAHAVSSADDVSIAFKETSEDLCLPRIIDGTSALNSSASDLSCLDLYSIQETSHLGNDPMEESVAIAPLPPAILTGAGMFIGGALLRLIRKLRRA